MAEWLNWCSKVLKKIRPDTKIVVVIVFKEIRPDGCRSEDLTAATLN